MAKVNPLKLKQDADKLEKAGRLEQAITLYRQIVDENPRDWNTINKIGDLYAKLNRPREASEQYAKVADFYAKDGFHLKAIAIWKKINKLDGAALEPYLNLADLYAKQGLMMEAKSQYQIVVDEYVKRGRTRDAGEVLRKMADIDPGDLKIRSKLADLYTRDGSAAKAVDEHVAIAEQLHRKGHLAEALQVLEKGLKIDARSPRLRLELGRVHLLQKNHQKAIPHLEEAVKLAPEDVQVLARLGEAYVGAHRAEEAEAIFKRLLELQPGDTETLAHMGRLYVLTGRFDEAYEQLAPVADRLIEQRDLDGATGVLQQITQKNAVHVPTLVKLAEIHRAQKNDTAMAATYSHLAEAYLQQGEAEQAASVLELLIGLEPQNHQHRTKLEFVRSQLGAGFAGAAPAPVAPPPAAPPTVSQAPTTPAAPAVPAAPAATPFAGESEFLEEEFELPEEEPAPAPAAAATSPPAAAPAARPVTLRPSIEISPPLTDEDREFIEEHMAEGKVFRKYGLVDKAADQFESIVARFPDHVEAREELREVFKEKGQARRAAEHCLALADIARLHGNAAGAQRHEAEARQLAPDYVAEASAPVVLPAELSGRIAPAAPEPPGGAVPPARTAAPAEEPAERAEEEEIVLAVDQELSLQDEEVAPEASPEEAPIAAGLEVEPGEAEATLDLGDVAEGEDADEFAGSFVEEEPEPVEAHVPPPAIAEGLDEAALPADESRFGEPALEAPAEGEEKGAPFALEIEAPDDESTLPELEPGAPAEETPALDLDLEPELALDSEPPSPLDAGDRSLEPLDGTEMPPPLEPAIVAGPDLESVPAPAAAGPRASTPAVAGRDAPAAAASLPAELERVLQEVDEYFALGFLDDAVDALREAASRHPGHPAIAAKIEALGLEPGLVGLEPSLEASVPEPALEAPDEELLVPAPEPLAQEEAPLEVVAVAPDPIAALSTPSFVAVPEPEGVVDLGAELDELFRAQPAVEEPSAETGTDLGDSGLADIFKEFKKGVDRQLGKEDYDTRYNLGIAYKEMGLVDEAIAEFQLAAKDESRLLECSSMLGICFMEKGMPKLAVRWFEKGLQAKGRTEEEYQGLRYDLALAHEASGDLDRALGIYTDLYGQDANFRDVAAKVRELRGARR